jgi:glycosyltransferase involved in cell wall biosynthesis
MVSDSLPLVSCIMPTADRRPFAALAIRYFLAQEYPNRELIVLDDGADPIADLIPSDARVRYERLPGKRAVGAKRNICVEASHGDLILHWDDDDWMASHRIRYQVENLLERSAELCGLRRMLFHDLGARQTWLYQYLADQRFWLAGGSLLYSRDIWRRAPFPEISSGEDTRFVWAQNARRAVALPDHTFYVAMIHPGNTSPKVRVGPSWSRWTGDLAQLMGDDTARYAALSGRPTATTARPVRVGSAGGQGMKLNLGCCDTILPDYVNVDAVAGPGVEVVDLRQPWPWGDGAVAHARAWDIVEHLPDKVHTMNELWRVLAPGGTAEVAVPTTDGPGAFQDPTHVSFWNRRSFLYYEAGNPYRERFKEHYGIRAKFRVVSERTDPSPDGPRLTIVLQAAKP